MRSIILGPVSGVLQTGHSCSWPASAHWVHVRWKPQPFIIAELIGMLPNATLQTVHVKSFIRPPLNTSILCCLDFLAAVIGCTGEPDGFAMRFLSASCLAINSARMRSRVA